MTGLKLDITGSDVAPAKVHVIGAERVVQGKWSRRTLLFILVFGVILWTLIALSLLLIV